MVHQFDEPGLEVLFFCSCGQVAELFPLDDVVYEGDQNDALARVPVQSHSAVRRKLAEKALPQFLICAFGSGSSTNLHRRKTRECEEKVKNRILTKQKEA